MSLLNLLLFSKEDLRENTDVSITGAGRKERQRNETGWERSMHVPTRAGTHFPMVYVPHPLNVKFLMLNCHHANVLFFRPEEQLQNFGPS
jgi:hypothetical protein